MKNMLLAINILIATTLVFVAVLVIWHGYTFTIGKSFSFEQYPLKRFFTKSS